METRHDLGPAYAALAGEGEETWFQPNRMTIKAGREHTAGAYGLLETWVRAGSSPPLHVHHREDEAFYVLEGQVLFHCDGREVLAGPGSYVFLPRGVPHTFLVEGDEDAHLLTLISPGGGERFFVGAAGRRAPEAGLGRVRRRDRQAAAAVEGPPDRLTDEFSESAASCLGWRPWNPLRRRPRSGSSSSIAAS